MIDEHDAIARLVRGEVVAVPTDTVYGLAVAVDVPGATQALFALKGRPSDVAIPVLIAHASDADDYATFSESGRALAGAHWPGPLTLVGTRTAISANWDLGGDGSTVGLRCPADDRVSRLAIAAGPLATTSANKHGERPCTTAAEVMAALGDVVVVDGGMCNGEPSTVVDATRAALRVLRVGAIAIG